jgi:hypothetical protein
MKNMTDTELLNWIEEHKPDIWYRTGFGGFAVSDDMTDQDSERYEHEFLRVALMAAAKGTVGRKSW